MYLFNRRSLKKLYIILFVAGHLSCDRPIPNVTVTEER